jgi:hypothetical protein
MLRTRGRRVNEGYTDGGRKGQIQRFQVFPSPCQTQWFKRVQSAASFYAAFRPLFREVGRWCTGIPIETLQRGCVGRPLLRGIVARCVRVLMCCFPILTISKISQRGTVVILQEPAPLTQRLIDNPVSPLKFD